MPDKSCLLDPVPTWLIKRHADLLSPFVTVLVNSSLQSGTVPSDFKNAVVFPTLKKLNLDPHDLSNYRPISNLPFLSKLLEKAVHQQLFQFLSDNCLLPSLQSAYRRFFSTETALL